MNVLYLCPLCHQNIVGWRAADPAPNYCDRCNRVFPPGVRPRLLDAPAPVTRPIRIAGLRQEQSNPLLVAPHRCHACGVQLRDAFNKRATEQIHLAGGILCRTSVYAVLFNPPCCGAYLEAPASLAGTSAPCPECRQQLDIPHDIIWRRPIAPAEPLMAFDCPACRAELHVPTTYRGESVAGLKAVCIACCASIEVPASGRVPRA